MTDIEIAYQILHDYTYSGDQLLFELKLNKISDTKLRLGLLFELFGKSESYQVDKSKIVYMLKLQSEDILEDIMSNPDDIIEYQQYFINQLKPFVKSKSSGSSMKQLNECIQFLEWLTTIQDLENVIWSENEDISNKIKALSEPTVKTLKDILIKQEQFEEVVQMEKILNA